MPRRSPFRPSWACPASSGAPGARRRESPGRNPCGGTRGWPAGYRAERSAARRTMRPELSSRRQPSAVGVGVHLVGQRVHPYIMPPGARWSGQECRGVRRLSGERGGTVTVHAGHMNAAETPAPGLPVRRAARVILLDPADRVLLMRYDQPPPNGQHWATPGGGAEDGEDYPAAALRELAEETGWT